MRSLFTPYKILLLGIVTGIVFTSMLHAQETPRYNRFQYHKYHWNVYHSKPFHVYFPNTLTDSVYRFIVKEMPIATERLKKATLKELPKDINIIVYPSIDQAHETNIGAYEIQQFTFPTFLSKGTRIVLAYNGSYSKLKYDLDEALARALWEAQIKNTDENKSAKSTGKKKKGADKDNIPAWFREGAVRYFAHKWTIDAEDQLRNSFAKNNFTTWQQVLNYEPRLGGYAFCYFLTEQYYPMAVAQTLFQLKKKKNLSRALKLVTKTSMDSLYIQCFNYYQQRFKPQKEVKETVAKSMVIHHAKGIVSNVLVNPTGEYIAYIATADNKRTVYIYDVGKQKTTKLTRYLLAPWIDEHSAEQYPLLQWHKDGRQLYVAYPQKGKMRIKRYGIDGKHVETTTLYGVDGITSFEPLSDRDFLLGAYRLGQSDIVRYNDNKLRYYPMTDDEYDDASPVLTGKPDQPLVFVSDRPKVFDKKKYYLIGVGYKKDTLWQGIYATKDTIVIPIKIDSIPWIKWDKPVLLPNGDLLVTSTKDGAERDFLIAQNGSITQLGDHEQFQYLKDSNVISSFRADKDSIYITQQPLPVWIAQHKAPVSDTSSPWLHDFDKRKALQAKEDSLLHSKKDTTHYFMDEVFKQKKQADDSTAAKGKKKKKRKYSDPKDNYVAPYILQLQSAYFTAQVNNDYFINRYQPYLNYLGQYKFPELGGMTKGGFTDLLENHHFTIMYSLPVATPGSDFFAQYENTEKKIDWGLSYFRKVETLQPNPSLNWVDENGNKYPDNAKAKTHYYELFFRDPLTYDCAMGLQLAVRQDKTIFLATDKYSLDFLPIQSTWSINTLSYKLNKLKPTIPYLFKGFKMDAYLDGFKAFSQDEAALFGITANARYHLPIYKYITLVTQLHAGYSGGDEKLLYNLGGLDNNVTPRVDTTVHFAQTSPYAFMTLVTPFRGYLQNSLYGNEYVLANIDLYFPIFQTLIPISTPLPFINNIQLGTLCDVASARETWNDNNPNNDKMLWSYGLSARSVLAGYPLRIDVAWPGTFNKQPVWYFSLNLQ